MKDDVRMMREDVIHSNRNKIYKLSLNHFKKSGEKIAVEIYRAPILIDDKDCILTIAVDITNESRWKIK